MLPYADARLFVVEVFSGVLAVRIPTWCVCCSAVTAKTVSARAKSAAPPRTDPRRTRSGALSIAVPELTTENTVKVYARYGIDLESISDLRFP